MGLNAPCGQFESRLILFVFQHFGQSGAAWPAQPRKPRRLALALRETVLLGIVSAFDLMRSYWDARRYRRFWALLGVVA